MTFTNKTMPPQYEELTSMSPTHSPDTTIVQDDEDDEDEEECQSIIPHEYTVTPTTTTFRQELVQSAVVVVWKSKLNIILWFAPLAFVASKYELLGEAYCFCFAGLALIPLAERLSFVTEQVAEHTNGTIGALLNATFGNAPEFLLSSAALRNGYYRLVQLTLLGSILCNLLFVFGLSCLVGGLHYQTQEIRVTSGNVSIGMLFIATLGLVLPAVLKVTNRSTIGGEDGEEDEDAFTSADLSFSRFNAVIMIVGYACYMLFQLGTHLDEFDYSGDEYAMFGGGHNIVRIGHSTGQRKRRTTRRNQFCLRHCRILKRCQTKEYDDEEENENRGLVTDEDDEETTTATSDEFFTILKRNSSSKCTRRSNSMDVMDTNGIMMVDTSSSTTNNDNELKALKRKTSDPLPQSQTNEFNLVLSNSESTTPTAAAGLESSNDEDYLMSMRMGIVWLGVITVGISFMSNIIVDTIDGFAKGSNITEVFTSVIIIPYFSNIAEQVSAVIFANRNKMDLCVGVTVGSAIQIAQCVLPGCVLVAWWMDRPMTLYFRIYETVCLVFGVLCMAAVIQGGTTNWVVGIFFMSVYFMIAAGFCFHETEILSIDPSSTD